MEKITEPAWKIKPKKYKTFRGETVYGLAGKKENEGGMLWRVAYADAETAEFLGLEVGDFIGSPVGEVWDARNLETAIDEGELEMAALIAEARAEFGA